MIFSLQHLRSIAPLALLTMAGAAAQGADDCAMAMPITGAGPHSFDNTAATTSGTNPTCINIVQDVWFVWTAAVSGPHIFQTCNLATNDTTAAIYTGGCAGTQVGCNDDACGLQSRIDFTAVAGQQYWIQLGSFSVASAGAGAFTVQIDAPLLNPANGNFYRVVSGTLSWQAARTAAAATSWMGRTGHLATITSQAELDWIIQNVAPSRPWIGLFQNTSSPTYSEPSNGWEWVTGEPTSFVNWAPGEPNNNSASGGPEDYCELFGNGQWNDAELNHAQTSQYLVEYSNAGLGTNYCSPANAHTGGMSAQILATGSNQASANSVILEASALPLNQFGFFLTSQTQGFVTNPGGSQGNLCLAGVIGRYVGPGFIKNSGATGAFNLTLNLQQTPAGNVFVAVLPGQTWNFQAWFRDIGPQGQPWSNFTDATNVLFQ